MKKTQMILLAAGEGNRFGGNLPKQFVKIAGKTIIEHTLCSLEKNNNISSIIIVINPNYYDYMTEILLRNNFFKIKKLIKGGNTRQESSYLGLCACDDDTRYVLFHDAIRPFISNKIINDVIDALNNYEAVDVAIMSADTLIKVNDDNIIQEIPKRKYLMRGQTPQGFRIEIIRKAYEKYMLNPDMSITDDCGLIVKYGMGKVYVVLGEEKNIKITYKEDAYLADKLFQLNSIELINNEKFLEKLDGKVSVIFGHTSGIGEEIYNTIKNNKNIVYGFSRRNGVDVSNYKNVEDSLNMVFKKENKIDYIINTSGILSICKLENMSENDINEVISINYIGAVNITKASIPFLKQTKGSIILFTSSSYTRGRAMYSIYSSTKAAIVNFVQAVSEEYKDAGIRINVINPERTDTPMRRKNFGNEPVDTLLPTSKVSDITLKAVTSDITGQVIDVRKNID